MKITFKHFLSEKCRSEREAVILDVFGSHRIPVTSMEDCFQAETAEDLAPDLLRKIEARLLESGIEIVINRDDATVYRIEEIIGRLVRGMDETAEPNYYEELSARLHYSRSYLSHWYSVHRGKTIEQFIVASKIERVKTLLVDEGLSLTEIAYRLHYSSVAYLSAQFKKIAGVTPSQFKKHTRNRMLRMTATASATSGGSSESESDREPNIRVHTVHV